MLVQIFMKITDRGIFQLGTVTDSNTPVTPEKTAENALVLLKTRIDNVLILNTIQMVLGIFMTISC